MAKPRLVALLAFVSLFNTLFVTAVPAQQLPRFLLRSAPELQMPGAHENEIVWGVDGNSPAERDAAGRLIIFNSWGYPWRSIGANLFQMATSERITIFNREAIEGGLWLEATYRDADGTIFGWFHNEISAGCDNGFLAVPRIRQMVSRDQGLSWEDFGVIIEAPADSLICDTPNMYFAGGHGDFSVLYDAATQHFYFYFTTYNQQREEQGIGIARLAYQDRYDPVGKAWKWDGVGWREPGQRGHVKPIFPPVTDWHQPNVDAYWGPALHYNTYLRQYVMLLNRASNPEWAAEGIYISFNRDLGNPNGWSELQRLLLEMDSPSLAYPQVIGLEANGTDKIAGQVSRLFLLGQSFWELVFEEGAPIPSRQPGSPSNQSPPQRTSVRP
jgi:hypothetical protein